MSIFPRLVAFVPVLLALWSPLGGPSARAGLEPAAAARAVFGTAPVRNVTLAPGGRWVALQMEAGGRRTVATLELATGTLRGLEPHGGYEVTEYDWADADTLVYYVGSLGRYYRSAVATTPDFRRRNDLGDREDTLDVGDVFVWMVDPTPFEPGSVLANWIPWPETGGIVYDDLARAALFRVDTVRDVAQRVVDAPFPVAAWYADLSGKVRAASLRMPAGVGVLRLLGDDGTWRQTSLPVNTSIGAFDPSGGFALVSYPGEGGRRVAQGYSLEKDALAGRPIADPVCDVEPLVRHDPMTRALISVQYAGVKPVIHYFDPAYRALHRRMTDPEGPWAGAFVDILGGTATGAVLVAVSTSLEPTSFHLVEPEAARAEPLTARTKDGARVVIGGPTARVPGEALERDAVTVPTRDGRVVHGYLTAPRAAEAAGERVRPLLLLVHGGPWVRDTWAYDPEAAYFALLGFNVLQVNYRGSSGHGDAYGPTEIAAVARVSVDDLADGVAWAIREGLAKPGAVAIYGASFGGYAAVESLARHPDQYACGAAFAGVYDWNALVSSDRRDDPEMVHRRTDLYGDIERDADAFRALSPIHRARAIRAPLLLLHGGADTRVAISQTRRMADAVRDAGGRVEVETDAWGTHGLPSAAKRVAFYERVGAFLVANTGR